MEVVINDHDDVVSGDDNVDEDHGEDIVAAASAAVPEYLKGSQMTP